MSYYYISIRCIKCNNTVSNVLFMHDKRENIYCYDVTNDMEYVFCQLANSVCTTSMKLVKSTINTSSIYSEARFEKV